MNWYGRFIHNWENKLCNRATNRVVRDFEWGLDWIHEWPASRVFPRNGHTPYEYVRDLNEASIRNSADFFAYEPPSDFELVPSSAVPGKPLPNGRGSEGPPILRFTSPVHTPYPENNIVHGQWFPAKSSKKAIVLLPHWNAPGHGHNAVCRGLQKLGISALRISLPYHDFRMPPELQRADYAVSSNIGRTLEASRQAVIDVRSCFDWLETQGYERLGIVGTSLGSCYACLAAAHDPRIRVNVFNHCATYFADVVWTGLSTRHIRQGLEGNIDLERLRECWQSISPVNYLDRFAQNGSKALFIYTTYDTTFLPEFSVDIVERVRKLGVNMKVVALPCGHYTLGETPFKFIDGYHICSYLKRNL